MFAIAVVIRLPTLAFPLVESHAFRQTQTAYAAVVYHLTQIDLLHTPLPTIGPPWELPFEFPLFQAIAATAMNAGLTPEVALRATDLAFFLISAVALLLLIRVFVDRSRSTIVLAVYLFSPFSLVWSRASIIEYLALATTMATIVAVGRYDSGHGRAWLVVATALAILASLVKITTAAVWFLPAIVFARRRLPVASVAAVGMIAGMLWTIYADTIKASGPLSRYETSRALFDYNFGTLGDRFDPTIAAAIIANLTPLGLLGLAGLVFARQLRRGGEGRLIFLCAGVVLTALAALPTLYARHSYYAVAISPAIAMLIGLSLDAALAARSVRYVRSVGAALVLATFIASSPLWTRAFGPSDPDHELVSADQIRSATDPQDRIIIIGRDYSPAILFYADRAGIAVPSAARLSDLPPEILASYLVFDCGIDSAGTCRPISVPAAP